MNKTQKLVDALALELQEGEMIRPGFGPNSLAWTMTGDKARDSRLSFSVTIHSDGSFHWAVNRGNGWKQWSRKNASVEFIGTKIETLRAWLATATPSDATSPIPWFPAHPSN